MTHDQIKAMLETRSHFKSIILAIDEMALRVADMDKESFICFLGKEKSHFTERLRRLDDVISIDGQMVDYEGAAQ